jgi:AcrR family transcriptional regulator
VDGTQAAAGVVTARAEKRRAEILEAALELFAERGYHATGVADIASRLRMSHGTFYRYFDSKRDILDHVVDGLVVRIAEAVAATDGPGTADTLEIYREQVRRIAEALVAVVFEDPRIPQVLLFEATGVDDELTSRVLRELDTLRALTAAYLQHGVDAGFLRADLDVTETARALDGMIYAGALDAIRSHDPASARPYVRAALRLMFDGVAAR